MITNLHAVAQNLFKAERISKSSSFNVNGSVEDVFPLFGPIREKEWADGWDPEILFSHDKFVEEHMVFRTKASTDEGFYHWTVTQYRPHEYFIEYTVCTVNRIWFISVNCVADNRSTKVTVGYTYTSLNAKGDEMNRAAVAKMFSDDLTDWRDAINYYLATGKMLTSN
jgi:hypothetical protein